MLWESQVLHKIQLFWKMLPKFHVHITVVKYVPVLSKIFVSYSPYRTGTVLQVLTWTGNKLVILLCWFILLVCTYCKTVEPERRTYKKCSLCKKEGWPDPRFYCSKQCQGKSTSSKADNYSNSQPSQLITLQCLGKIILGHAVSLLVHGAHSYVQPALFMCYMICWLHWPCITK